MPEYYIIPIYTAALALLVVAVVPRQEIRRLSFYGIFLGALIDMVLILILTNVLDIGGYKNYGPFAFAGIPFFPPIAWVAYFILFFYFIPHEKPWNYIFVLGAAFYSTMFSNVLLNLGVFEWNYGRLIIPFIIYLSWFTFNTWAYYRFNQVLEQHQTKMRNISKLRLDFPKSNFNKRLYLTKPNKKIMNQNSESRFKKPVKPKKFR